MFTGDMKEKEQEVICLNGISAIGMQELLDYAYTSTLTLTSGNKEYFLLFWKHWQIQGGRKQPGVPPLPGLGIGGPPPILAAWEISTFVISILSANEVLFEKLPEVLVVSYALSNRVTFVCKILTIFYRKRTTCSWSSEPFTNITRRGNLLHIPRVSPRSRQFCGRNNNCRNVLPSRSCTAGLLFHGEKPREDIMSLRISKTKSKTTG